MKKLISIFFVIMLITSNAYAQIPDISASDIISGEGEVFDTTTKGYTEIGLWNNEGTGFDNRAVKTSTAADAVATWSISREPTYYDVYIWKNVVDGGADDIAVELYATGTSQSGLTMNLSEGISEWIYAGCYFTSDGSFKVTIHASSKGKTAACAFRMVKSDQESFQAFMQNASNMDVKELKMTIDSDIAYLDGKEKKLTMGCPIIKNDRTLVPVRFVSEVMGKNIEWNESERKVTVSDLGNTVEFFIGSMIYKVNGVEMTLDCPAEIISDRTYIPVRFMAEALGKKVDYNDRVVTIY